MRSNKRCCVYLGAVEKECDRWIAEDPSMWSSMPGEKEVLVGLHAHMASCILLPAGHSETMMGTGSDACAACTERRTLELARARDEPSSHGFGEAG